MNITIGIATRGRPAILAEVLAELDRQTRPPEAIVICPVGPEDVAGIAERFPGVRIISGPVGLTRQRNAIMDASPDADVILFLDDDFLCAPEWLAVLEEVMQREPDCVVATGTVIADGAKGPGITVEEGRAFLAADTAPADPLATIPHFNGYGCNMAVRMAPVRAHGLRFDEALPAYGWYEDLDFTRRLLPYGTIRRLAGARGVHMGAKVGRTPGRKLGYSQVVNSIYLARKGSYPWSHALRSAGRHLLINGLKSLRPEPEVDRWGRFQGNLRGLWHVLTGQAHPGRISEL
ncbi:glycosyltransferase family 2 protein [Rhodovarius crocodyli]|uniref:Glycosyltransferase family 2 protein n=1 Tax=Rhodovarius crocodyli TaxID=1979269 RepID=A0A437MIV2_9PROT|nr:glycosyltransferase [Rhodovarius crocodyli]RVT97551.1 glycosyltransferase family 2 protein [Rhodovarius crocodyli]